MAENICVNQEKIQEDANQLEGAAACLKSKPLSSPDTRTTISANAGSRLCYEKEQENLELFGVFLDQEAEKIRGLGIAFAEFDEMIGGFSERR